MPVPYIYIYIYFFFFNLADGKEILILPWYYTFHEVLLKLDEVAL